MRLQLCSSQATKYRPTCTSSYNVKFDVCFLFLQVDDIEILVERMKKLDENDEEEVTREEMDRRFEKEKEEALQGHYVAYG